MARRSAAVALGVLLIAPAALAQYQQPPPPGGYPPSANPLAPPPPISTPPPQQGTQQKLDQAKAEDSGRGLELFYAQFEPFGIGYYDMGAFSDKLGLQSKAHGGANIGLASGVRYLIWTFGARFRYQFMSAFNLYQLNAVIGIHIPKGRWDPYGAIHGGLTGSGSIDPYQDQNLIIDGTEGNASVLGGNFGISGGLDYYFFKFLSAGADATFDVTVLSRKKVTFDANLPPAKIAANPLASKSGSGIGMGISIMLHVGFHL